MQTPLSQNLHHFIQIHKHLQSHKKQRPRDSLQYTQSTSSPMADKSTFLPLR